MKQLLLVFILLISTSIRAYMQSNFIDQILISHEFYEKEIINLKD